MGEKAGRRFERDPGVLSPTALSRSLEYVGDNLASDLSLEDMARTANLSPRHFSRGFKEATGLSTYPHVIRERVERAKGLLLGSDLSVGEVALSCGFSHQGHLARHFVRLTGTTPARFRAQARR
jgi:AraC family transcriptional regulator